jgi:hypothetical protein
MEPGVGPALNVEKETRQIFRRHSLLLIEATARVGTPAETLSAYERAVSAESGACRP